MKRRQKFLLRLPVRRNLDTFPKFQWLESGREEGRWVLGLGPSTRYRLGGVPSGQVVIAMMLGDTEYLNRSGYQWFDSQSRADDWQSRWHSKWPEWLWPRISKPCPSLVLELARKDGIAPRLASNAPDYDWVRNCWRPRRRAGGGPCPPGQGKPAQPLQLTLVLGVGLKRKGRS